jgi:ElaB/YqjD/DUF883 family membrane-anchored ribosome-binding protein
MGARTSEMTQHQLVEEFNIVVAEAEQLLKSVAGTGGEKAEAIYASVERNLATAKNTLLNLEQSAFKKAKVAALATDEYAHEHPWESVGIAAGVGALVGVLIGLSMNRR